MKSYRFSWIEASLRYTGRFGPSEKASYQDIFQLSAPSVSRHQDVVAKALEEACDSPLFRRDANDRWSGGKLMLLPGSRLPENMIFGRVPTLDRWLEDAFSGKFFHTVEVPRSRPEPDIVRPIMRALEDEHPLRIRYQSRSGPSTREISPHVIVKAAGRLHVRAFDHSTNQYKDFVLSRIQSIHPAEEGKTRYVDSSLDSDWRHFVTIEIRERKSSDSVAAFGVRMDFSLDDKGCKRMRVRKALAPYVVDIDGEDFSEPVTIHASSTVKTLKD